MHVGLRGCIQPDPSVAGAIGLDLGSDAAAVAVAADTQEQRLAVETMPRLAVVLLVMSHPDVAVVRLPD